VSKSTQAASTVSQPERYDDDSSSSEGFNPYKVVKKPKPVSVCVHIKWLISVVLTDSQKKLQHSAFRAAVTAARQAPLATTPGVLMAGPTKRKVDDMEREA